MNLFWPRVASKHNNNKKNDNKYGEEWSNAFLFYCITSTLPKTSGHTLPWSFGPGIERPVVRPFASSSSVAGRPVVRPFASSSSVAGVEFERTLRSLAKFGFRVIVVAIFLSFWWWWWQQRLSQKPRHFGVNGIPRYGPRRYFCPRWWWRIIISSVVVVVWWVSIAWQRSCRRGDDGMLRGGSSSPHQPWKVEGSGLKYNNQLGWEVKLTFDGYVGKARDEEGVLYFFGWVWILQQTINSNRMQTQQKRYNIPGRYAISRMVIWICTTPKKK